MNRTNSSFRSSKQRALRLEPLERRDLLSAVAAATETFQPAFDFTTGSIAISGTFPEQGHAIPFSGSLQATTGNADYSSSRTQGDFSLSNLQGSGTWNAFGVDWGTITISEGTVSGTDNNGAVVAQSGSGDFTVIIVSTKAHPPKTYYNGPLDFTMGGSFNAPQEKFSLKGKGTSEAATLNLSGGFTVASSPYSIAVSTPTPAWTQPAAGQSPALQVDVAVTGPVHTASSYTSPAASVALYWADANGNEVSSTALPVSLGVDWDEASGTYNITGLPLPPSTAADILLVPVYNGTTGTPLAVPLPAQPVLAIAGPAAAVVRLKSGTTPAVFTVTLPAPSPFPVTVQYTTVPGTAMPTTDYTAVSGMLTFAPGVTSQTITVAVKANEKAAAAETFFVALATPTWATLDPNDTQAVCAVDPFPVQVLAIQGPSSPVVRPKSGTTPAVFTVTLPAPNKYAVTVQYSTVPDTAKSPTDYTLASGTLTFKAGVTSRTITVAVKASSTATVAEDFYVKLANPTWATLDPNDTQAVCTVEPFGFTTPSVLQGDASLNRAAIDAILAETSSGQA